jgi:alpha-amylase
MLVIHNHQPVGQFGYVNEHSTNVSYLPMIEALERHPRIKIGMHYSGPLLDWLKQHHSEVVDRLRVLVARKQVEMISGGYYDPIMVMLPDDDKIGQIEKMNAEIKAALDGQPTGMWISERVWEPQLARPIAQAGLRYVIVDDTHFEMVGFDREKDLFGYYVTEEQGFTVAVFPTLTYLRYTIPWEPVPALMSWLRTQADQPLTTNQPKIAFMGDDGEKFGTWPGTFQHCWGDGKYMETLFGALERNVDWVKTATPSEYMSEFPALGRVYLPSASYREMGEWSLPPERSHQLIEIKNELESANRPDILSFVRGGIWRNFLVKYDEINHMQKRTLMVSQKIHDMRRGRKRDQALELLWAAQSNDPYWHGLFGGIYLFNFRVATYANLIAAEDVADNGELTITLQRTDFDRDSHEDVVLTSTPFNAIWSPAKGGALLELDFRPAQYNLLNIMTRRMEGYHSDLTTAAANGNVITPMSAGVSDFGNSRDRKTRIVRAKESGLEKLLIYDWHRRASFLDHFLGPSTSLDEFYRAHYAEQGDFVNQPYQIMQAVCDGVEVTLQLARNGHVWVGDIHQPVHVQKTFNMAHNNATLRVVYELTHTGDTPIDVRFGIESVIGFDGGQDIQYCSVRIDDDPTRLRLNGLREFEGVRKYYADTNLRNITLRTDVSKPAFLWQFPLETITLSEAGFERGYQGTVFLQWWNIRLTPGEPWTVIVGQTVNQTATRP